jgi:hypothetical protein
VTGNQPSFFPEGPANLQAEALPLCEVISVRHLVVVSRSYGAATTSRPVSGRPAGAEAFRLNSSADVCLF